MIDPTTLTLSGLRIRATYDFHGDPAEARRRADALRVEQTIEFPADLVPDDDIQREVVGRVESLDEIGPDVVRAVVSYAVETTGWELPQLLNVLWGNSSIQPGVRLVDVALPEALLDHLPGPRFGVSGLRRLLDATDRPLLATALKPMGLSPERLAAQAYELAVGGLDLVKDDHSLANQEFAAYRERVLACSEAVRRASEDTGRRVLYLPSLNAPFDELERRLDVAVSAGVGGLLVLPGLTGLDHLRHLARSVDLPLMGHPALLGSFTASPTSGIAHGVVYGTLMRVAGADLSIFPSYGGRFSFSRDECREIATALTAPLPATAPAFPTPGGGMTLDRVPEILDFYGPDVALLIGGDLHRGESLRATAAAFRSAIGA